MIQLNLLSLSLILVQSLAHAGESAHAKTGVSAETSLGWLENGNKRFLGNKLRNDGQSASDRQRLSKGQQPHAIVLSCSDSRAPPEIVFDQKLGELFVVRTAGQSLDDNVVGSIEYAVEHLGSQLIVVMGHTSCGAVKAALGTLNGASAGTPALDGLVKDMHPRLKAFKSKEPSAHFHTESFANAREVAVDLAKRSKLLQNRLAAGKLKIVSSVCELESGRVVFGANEPTLRAPASRDSHESHH